MNSSIEIYQTIEVRLDGEQDTLWLSQEQLSALFGRERSVISKHLRNVFKEGELSKGSVCANFAHSIADAKSHHE